MTVWVLVVMLFTGDVAALNPVGEPLVVVNRTEEQCEARATRAHELGLEAGFSVLTLCQRGTEI